MSEHLLLLSAVLSSLNISKCQWKPCTLMPSHCYTMFHRCCFMLWIMSCSKPSPYFFLLSFWYRLILISAIQRMLFLKWSGFFRCLLAKSNLGLHLVVNPLYLLSWSLLCGRPGLYILLSSPVHSVYFIFLQNVQNCWFALTKKYYT